MDNKILNPFYHETLGYAWDLTKRWGIWSMVTWSRWSHIQYITHGYVGPGYRDKYYIIYHGPHTHYTEFLGLIEYRKKINMLEYHWNGDQKSWIDVMRELGNIIITINENFDATKLI